MINLYSL